MQSLPAMNPLESLVKHKLDKLSRKIGQAMQSDVLSITGPLMTGLDRTLRQAIELQPERKFSSVSIILDTLGGVIGAVERMVTLVRFHYNHVAVIVPDKAMSAGTIFALSANRIFMDYFSILGPIDPQIEKDGQLVPAQAYLNQFDLLKEKSADGSITAAEYALVNKFDPAELYQFEQAVSLSTELVEQWLFQYMLSDLNNSDPVADSKDQESMISRAHDIATRLNDHERWRYHGRGITMETLRNEVELPIEDLADSEQLYQDVRDYADLVRDYAQQQSQVTFVHSHGLF